MRVDDVADEDVVYEGPGIEEKLEGAGSLNKEVVGSAAEDESCTCT